MNIKTASILPLDYGPRRVEHSITLTSIGDWDELAELLIDPRSYFAAQQFRWSTSGPTWDLLPKATIIIEPAYLQPQALVTIGNAAGIATETILPVGVNEEVRLTERAAGILQHSVAAYETLQETAPAGTFYAEFAVNTAMLTVMYVLPAPDRAREPEVSFAESKTKRYKGRILDPTLGLSTQELVSGGDPAAAAATQGPNPSPGILHFDITGDAIDRADFAVDWLTHAAPIAADLSNHPGLKIGTGTMAAQSGTLQKMVPAKATTPPRLIPSLTPGRIVVENASPDRAMCVCGTVPVYPSFGGLVLGALNLKDYPVIPCIGR